MKIAILTSPAQWFEVFASELANRLNTTSIYTNHDDIVSTYDILFILSYHKIVDDVVLKKNTHNIVIHASDLPKGKGWAPLFWQVIEGRNEIPFTLFEASIGADNGDFYFKDILQLTGYELNEELREKQAIQIMKMCVKFVRNYTFHLKKIQKQKGEESFYPKRTPNDSQLNIDKTIKEQFNLLRTANNDEYPAFFEINGKKFKLKIEEF